MFSAETLTAEDLRQLKADLSAAKRQVKLLEAEFLERLKQAVVKLDPETEEALVIRILRSDLQDRLGAQVASGLRALIDRYRGWADKYAVPLRDLEIACDTANQSFNAYLRELGYA